MKYTDEFTKTAKKAGLTPEQLIEKIMTDHEKDRDFYLLDIETRLNHFFNKLRGKWA